jgi:hypothetical protein
MKISSRCSVVTRCWPSTRYVMSPSGKETYGPRKYGLYRLVSLRSCSAFHSALNLRYRSWTRRRTFSLPQVYSRW